MKGFNYHSVKNVKEAKKLASGKSAFLAGGMTTIPAMKLRLASYSDIIDIKNIKDLYSERSFPSIRSCIKWLRRSELTLRSFMIL